MERNNLHLRKNCEKIIERYGFLLPLDRKVKYYTFTELIKSKFLITNPLVNGDIKFIQNNWQIIWERRNSYVTCTRIV